MRLTVPEMGLLELGVDAYREALEAFVGWHTDRGWRRWLDVPRGVRAAGRSVRAHALSVVVAGR